MKEKEPLVSVKKLRQYYDTAKSRYSKEHNRIRLLDAADNGQLWQALGAKFPEYQILPDTNWISYVKTNMVSSVYTVAKGADLVATNDEDRDVITKLNIALERIWSLSNVGHYQFQAGEWAALTNLGITQVGWDESLSMGGGSKLVKGNVALQNIDPMKFMRDPYATSLDTAGYCMTYDVYHKSVFLENSKYNEEFKKYLESEKHGATFAVPSLDNKKAASMEDDYYTLVTFWVKDDEGKINEIHTVNCEHVLYEKKDIQPRMFPFALLYCNLPRGGRLIGVSECAKIFSNNVAFNTLDSLALTAEYRNQNSPTLVSHASQLNMNKFQKHKDTPNYSFTVQGDPTKAVFPYRHPDLSPMATHMREGLSVGIQRITGVDERYTGRDTGSILTTGGMEDMLQRVTLVDTPKIANYEDYAKRLSKLILANYLEFAGSRKYLYKDKKTGEWATTEVDFPSLSKEAKKAVFHYELNISTLLPKNRQRVAQMATQLMEKQMQYGSQGGVDLIRPEEWLEMQDLPNKEFFLERMKIQRSKNLVEDIAETLYEYAELTGKQGLEPEAAITAIAKSKENQMMGMGPTEGIDPMMMEEQTPMM